MAAVSSPRHESKAAQRSHSTSSISYVPLIGLFILLTWGLADLTARWHGRRIVLGTLCAFALTACLTVTSRQLPHWRDSIMIFTQAIAVDPKNFVAHNNLALALGMAGRWEEALQHANEALRLKPDSAETHNLAGMILDVRHKTAEALAHYDSAAHLKPDWALPHLSMAQALTRQGRIPAAISHYTIALRLAPNDAVAHAELAWLLATHPRAEIRDGAEAVRLAERACELTRREESILLGTLAAAYAEAGRFPDAVKAAAEAQARAQAAGQTELAARQEQMLKLFQTKRPWREPAAEDQ